MLRENLEYNKNVKANSAFLEELKLKLPEFFTAEKKDDDGNVVEESKFDYLKFKKMLDEQNIEEFTSGYQLDFIGKNYAKKQSGERPNTVIVPDIEHNTKMENKKSKNIFLTGDNLEVLRHLQQNYQNSVDFIYIDPPYNTGNDNFVYPDNFEYNDSELKNIFGLSDEELKRLKSIQGNSSHSAWLTFMYPRIFLAKKLLNEDGVVFISIDDNEVANLILLANDIFGEQNFISNIVQKHRGGVSNDKIISENHNYLLFFVKNRMLSENRRSDFGVDRTEEDYKNYTLNDYDGRGFYTLNPVTGPGGARKGNPFYEFLGIKNYWRFSKEKMSEMYENGKIVKKNNTLYQKTYRSDMEGKRKGETTWWESYGTTSDGTNELKKLFGSAIFDFPKPTKLIKQCMKFSHLNKKALVLDFFAGSGTTADAVMQLNAEDGGNRKFILCTLPEKTYTVNADGTEIPTKGGTVAYEAGYKSIDEISRERIKRAAEKIKQENPDLADSLDLGFKHYRVVSPSVETLEDIEFNDVMQLDLLEDMISKFSSENLGVDGNATGIDTILQTYLVQDGYKFDVNIEYIELGEYKVPYINNQRIYIISNNWNNKATEKLVNMIGRNEIQVQTIVVYGYSFDAKNLRTLEYALNQLDNKVNLQIRY